MKKIWYSFNEILSVFSGGLLGLAMMATCIDVFMRYFFNKAIIGVVDLVTILIPIFVFLPLANTEIISRHIRVELFASFISKKWMPVLDLFDSVCGLVFLAVMAWAGLEIATYAWQTGEYLPGMLRLPLWPAKFAIFLGAFFFGIQIFINGVLSIKKIISYLLYGAD